MEFIKEFLIEIVIAILLLISTNIIFYIRKLQTDIRKFKTEQKKKDEEQDRIIEEKEEIQRERDEAQNRKLHELEAALKRKLDREEYFDKQRLIAYPKIRKFAQQARDEARLIDTPGLLPNHKTWIKNLHENYNVILELLRENALLLKYYYHYNSFHEFKNAFLSFYLAAKDMSTRRTDYPKNSF